MTRMKANRFQTTRLRAGFSIIELLIAVIIIGVLVAIIIPIVSERAKDARIAAAKSDLEHMADAEQRLALDIGYYVRLFVLDDMAGDGDGIGFAIPTAAGDYADAFRDEDANVYYSWNKDRFFIDSKTQQYVTGGDVILRNIQTAEPAVGTNVWKGPYLNWRRDELDIPDPNNPTVFYADDIGDDPWGNNYYLFLQEGIVAEPGGTIERNFDFPGAVNESCYRIFDRPTILSLRPNMQPGGVRPDGTSITQPGAGDDLVIHF